MSTSPFSLLPYPFYEDSGVPWLGEVPAHWGQLPGRACYREKKVPNTGMQETTVLSLIYGQIVVKPPEKLHGLVPGILSIIRGATLRPRIGPAVLAGRVL